jgi:hypothetical protein
MQWVSGGAAVLSVLVVCACSGAPNDGDDDSGDAGDSSGGTGGSTASGGKGGATASGGSGGSGGTTASGGSGGTMASGGSGGTTASGASGVPRTKYLDELSAAEIQALCEWTIPLEGGAGEQQCGDGVTVTTPTVEECSTSSVTIHCTVGMVEDCALSLNGDPCQLLSTAECAAYISCALG